MSHFEAPSSVAGDDVEHHHAPTIRVIAKMRTGPKISFQISNPNRTQPTVPSPDQMAYATPSGTHLRSKSHADKLLDQTGCSKWSPETSWHSLYHIRFTCKIALFESRRADSNRFSHPATSLLAYILARPSASGFQLVYASFGGS